MWPISQITTINMLSSFFGLFVDSDYSSDIVIKLDVNIIEKRLSAQSFEFSSAAMEAANAMAQNKFSNAFLFGAASSAYQIEGAYNSPGKGVSVWDYWTHNNQHLIKDKSNGDVACNSVYKYANDVELIKNLGANAHRISLSWSRILPNGLSNRVNLKGVRYYNELINTMVLNGVTPIVTIHHFDVPHKLQLMGGWSNPKMVEYFRSFARVAFQYFGDRVKHWITINDPWELCNGQFGNVFHSIYKDSGTANYLCGHHVLLAHAATYRMYHDEFQWLQKGKLGISLSTRWFEPQDYTSPADAEAAEVSHLFSNYWFLHPLIGENGGYPNVMHQRIGNKSVTQHYKQSRLPTFSQDEIDSIKGSLDFLGISFFTTYNARSVDEDTEMHHSSDNVLKDSVESDMSAKWFPYDESYGAHDIKNTAENFGKLLRRLHNDYILPQIYITANGYADFGEIDDHYRATYHFDHIKELFEAMKAGVDVRGYIAWSLMDSFEWKDGYSKRFGLYAVDFQDDNRPRKAKISTKVIKKIYESKRIPAFHTAIEI